MISPPACRSLSSLAPLCRRPLRHPHQRPHPQHHRFHLRHAHTPRARSSPPARQAPEPPAQAQPAAPSRLTRSLLATLNVLLALHLVAAYGVALSPAWGPSMLPTVAAAGDVLVVAKWRHARGRRIRAGDVVSFAHPVRAGFGMTKRVVGMPGDLVLRDTPRGPGEQAGGDAMMVRVPEGHCWVAGDNLEWSRDSRMFGPLPLALVRGKVVGKLWFPWAVPVPAFRWIGNGMVEEADAEE